MRRLASVAAFFLVLALPLWAQHGGGHGGGGGHAGGFAGHCGFSGGHASGGGFSSGMHSGSGAARAFTPHSSSSHRGYSQRGFSNRGIASRRDGRNRFRIRTYGFRNNCYGYPCRGGYYPWAYGGYYDPYWWWDTGSSSYDDDYNQDLATAAQMNRDNLDEQRMLRQEESDADQDAYAQTPRAPRAMRPVNASNNAQPGAAIVSNTVLVFRDEHKQEVSNYAIVGQTLWNFAPGHTQKIPLSALDLPATTKANEELGVTFRVPGSGEGQ